MRSALQQGHLEMLRRQQAQLANEIEALEKLPTNNELSEIGAYHDAVDPVFHALSMPGAPGPLPGEGADAYRRRMLNHLLPYTQHFKDIDVHKLPGKELAGAVGDLIVAEAKARADDKTWDGGNGTGLRKIIRRQPNGGPDHIEFAGNPKSWMAQFSRPTMFVGDFVNQTTGRSMVGRGW